MQCLAYARDRYEHFTGKNSPSSGMEVGEWWENAKKKSGTTTTSSVKEFSIACWLDNGEPATGRGHALYVGTFNAASGTHTCYEANWDGNGKTRILSKTPAEIKALPYGKKWLGCAYN